MTTTHRQDRPLVAIPLQQTFSWYCSLLLLSCLFLIEHVASLSTPKKVVSLTNGPTCRPQNSHLSSSTTSALAGFYVHIPYCRRRCRYCDFAIVPIGNDKNKALEQLDLQYREALLKELDLVEISIKSSAEKPLLSSIYIGGGTPSLAPTDTLQAVVDRIRDMFHVAHDAEVTMEMDPGTFTLDDLIKWKELLGLNRISLGVQALNDPVLEQLGRFHRVKDIYHAVDAIQRAGIDNYSIDLISGLPGVSLVDWAETLEKTIQDLKPVHLSIYDLQIEEGTVFGKWYSSDEASLSFNKPQLPSADDCAYMYKYASGYLRHLGYEHYEISSFAKSDYRSRHNQAYWAYHSQWYAVGLGATSLIQKHSFARPRAMSDYVKWVETQKLRNQPEWLPGKDDEEDDRLTEIVMTRLRTSEGLDLEWLENSFGGSVVESVLQGAQLALELKLAAVNDKCLKLVDPQGFLFSNSILSSIFLEIGLIQ